MKRDDEDVLITLKSDPASDSWGFVGVVSVGDYEAYRTIRAHTTPEESLGAAQELLADVLGALLAGQEWRSAQEEFGHAPRRTELQFGLRASSKRPPRGDDSSDPASPTS